MSACNGDLLIPCSTTMLIYKYISMLKRVAEHYVGIQNGSETKYRILAEAKRKGHDVEFDVLYYAQK